MAISLRVIRESDYNQSIYTNKYFAKIAVGQNFLSVLKELKTSLPPTPP